MRLAPNIIHDVFYEDFYNVFRELNIIFSRCILLVLTITYMGVKIEFHNFI